MEYTNEMTYDAILEFYGNEEGFENLKNLPENIVIACMKAESAGHCQYSLNGKPLCVIAQLGEMHGISAKDWAEGCRATDHMNSHLVDDLPYPPAVLSRLQRKWDRQWDKNTDAEPLTTNTEMLRFACTPYGRGEV